MTRKPYIVARLYNLIRPALMALPPEMAHNLAFPVLRILYSSPQQPALSPALKSKAFGLDFPNPVGLAAGFDKDAKIPHCPLRAGFGFVDVGTLTPQPQPGNPKPRMFRLKEDKALINRLGFNNKGFERALKRIKNRPERTGILGINIGANKATKDPIGDYEQGLKTFASVADYFTLNISSPNTPGLRDLQKEENLKELLYRISKIKENFDEYIPPLLIKIAPDLTDRELETIIKLAMAHKVNGLIIFNTTIDRPNSLKSPEKTEEGGLSGQPLFTPSTERLASAYKLSKGKLPLIGVGGVSNAQQAYEKILAGASLVQLYTGFIYEGPGIAKDINKGLISLLQKDGYKNVSEAVGKGVGNRQF